MTLSVITIVIGSHWASPEVLRDERLLCCRQCVGRGIGLWLAGRNHPLHSGWDINWRNWLNVSTHTFVSSTSHRLNGSSSPVLTATSHSYGKGQNSTLYKIKIHERILTKFSTVDYVPKICPNQIWWRLDQRGLLGKYVGLMSVSVVSKADINMCCSRRWHISKILLLVHRSPYAVVNQSKNLFFSSCFSAVDLPC